jgi:hypothetical protein
MDIQPAQQLPAQQLTAQPVQPVQSAQQLPAQAAQQGQQQPAQQAQPEAIVLPTLADIEERLNYLFDESMTKHHHDLILAYILKKLKNKKTIHPSEIQQEITIYGGQSSSSVSRCEVPRFAPSLFAMNKNDLQNGNYGKGFAYFTRQSAACFAGAGKKARAKYPSLSFNDIKKISETQYKIVVAQLKAIEVDLPKPGQICTVFVKDMQPWAPYMKFFVVSQDNMIYMWRSGEKIDTATLF